MNLREMSFSGRERLVLRPSVRRRRTSSLERNSSDTEEPFLQRVEMTDSLMGPIWKRDTVPNVPVEDEIPPPRH